MTEDEQAWREMIPCVKDIAESLGKEIEGLANDEVKQETRRLCELARDALVELQRLAASQSTVHGSGDDWRECLDCVERGAAALAREAASKKDDKDEAVKDFVIAANDIANQIRNLHRDLTELRVRSEKAPPTAGERAEKAAREAKAEAALAKTAAESAKANADRAAMAADRAEAAAKIPGGPR